MVVIEEGYLVSIECLHNIGYISSWLIGNLNLRVPSTKAIGVLSRIFWEFDIWSFGECSLHNIDCLDHFVVCHKLNDNVFHHLGRTGRNRRRTGLRLLPVRGLEGKVGDSNILPT